MIFIFHLHIKLKYNISIEPKKKNPTLLFTVNSSFNRTNKINPKSFLWEKREEQKRLKNLHNAHFKGLFGIC